jgi:hypothetical protein
MNDGEVTLAASQAAMLKTSARITAINQLPTHAPRVDSLLVHALVTHKPEAQNRAIHCA